VVALRIGLVEMVRASLIGAFLADVLLALGVAFLLGGRRYHVIDYNPAGARTYASMLMLAVVTLAVPAAFHRFPGASSPTAGSRIVDLATALVLLATCASGTWWGPIRSCSSAATPTTMPDTTGRRGALRAPSARSWRRPSALHGSAKSWWAPLKRPVTRSECP